MKDLAFFNETFNINKTTTYYLSLQLSTTGYTYCIIDYIKNRFEAVKHVNFTNDFSSKSHKERVAHMLKTDAFLNKSYKKVDFSFVSRKSTLVPTALFKRDNMNDLFAINHEITSNEELHYNKLNETEANNVFSIPSEITTILVERFPEIRFFNHATPLIRAAAMLIADQKISNTFIQININSELHDILIFDNGNLISYNSYTANSDIDLMYYITNLIQQLKIRVNTADIIISGEVEEKSEMRNLLKQFVPNAKPAKFTGRVNYNFENAPEHMFLNLLNLHRCE